MGVKKRLKNKIVILNYSRSGLSVRRSALSVVNREYEILYLSSVSSLVVAEGLVPENKFLWMWSVNYFEKKKQKK